MRKILFVSGGNTNDGNIIPLIKNQADSLKEKVKVIHFLIKGKGIKGYLKNLTRLNNTIRNEHIDIIHAHYSFSGVLAVLTLTQLPIVVSLMGTDIFGRKINKLLISLFRPFWSEVIVKSEEMKKASGITSSHIISNGVNFDIFYPMDKKQCQEDVGFLKSESNILFLADPNRDEKNFKLADEAYKLAKLKQPKIKLNVVYNISPKNVAKYLNASDVVVLTSKYEGSPNLIKEAMACSRPIVSTNVGDVSEIIKDTPGCYISSNTPKEFSGKILEALQYSEGTKGHKNVVHLSAQNIANKIIEIYEQCSK